MRDFFIRSFEMIVSAIVILAAIGVFIGGLVVMFNAQGGFVQGLVVWIVGAVYVLFLGGAMYLGLGIYQNTKRTADAIDALARR